MKSNLKKISVPSILGLIGLLFLQSCASIPKGATPVSPFAKEQYLGKWYEIARLDFRFERGLNNTTAEYTLNEDGTIKVDNQGYDYVKDEWRQAIGKAKFRGDEDVAALKVSFFGPFYTGYNVIALDPDYQYALVAGRSLDYLWILSRRTTIPEETKQQYLELAETLGYDTGELIWVEHNRN